MRINGQCKHGVPLGQWCVKCKGPRLEDMTPEERAAWFKKMEQEVHAETNEFFKLYGRMYKATFGQPDQK